MANQITHIAYANVVRKKFLADRQIDEAKFYIGNVFPDIRYIGNISRKETHPDNLTVEGLVKVKNSFELGRYCHVLIDQKRVKALRKLGFYDLFSKYNHLSYPMKFVEDEITYARVSNWPKIISYFDSILDEERKLVSEDVVIKWHKMIQDFFAEPPNIQSFTKFAIELNIDIAIIESVKEIIKDIKENKEVMRLIKITQENLFT